MGGEQVAVIRKPGITTTMKTMISYGQTHMTSLQTTGWGLKQESQDILDSQSHIFSGKLHLKYLMGFAEDYTKGILNVKQELILIIARTFKNSYIGEVDADLEIRASKDWKQWKKTWQDLRSKTKRKKSEQLKYTRGTEGGPPHPDELDDEDELILSTIPSTAITGDINIKETPIEFEFPSDGIIIDQPVDTQSPAVIVSDEIAEIVVNEHLYAKENVVPISTTAKTPKTKRTMASQRLHTSALAASTLAEVSQSTLEVQNIMLESCSYLRDKL
ncbi:unnamed protein product [Phaedon cochleariae]|uniref:Double jelly roll-like domain-containing protein n=1 Tax=Phaedon cochleariae TaxID=80249 RepID=A0A9N9X110_PHACE|nr:unnamed protein product [Phaedon cochleariae]